MYIIIPMSASTHEENYRMRYTLGRRNAVIYIGSASLPKGNRRNLIFGEIEAQMQMYGDYDKIEQFFSPTRVNVYHS